MLTNEGAVPPKTMIVPLGGFGALAGIESDYKHLISCRNFPEAEASTHSSTHALDGQRRCTMWRYGPPYDRDASMRRTSGKSHDVQPEMASLIGRCLLLGVDRT